MADPLDSKDLRKAASNLGEINNDSQATIAGDQTDDDVVVGERRMGFSSGSGVKPARWRDAKEGKNDVEQNLINNLDDLVMFQEATHLNSGRMRLQEAHTHLSILLKNLSSYKTDGTGLKASVHAQNMELLSTSVALIDAAKDDILGNISAKWDIFAQVEEKFKTMTEEEATALESVLSYASVDSPRKVGATMTMKPRSNYRRTRRARHRNLSGTVMHKRSSSAHNLQRALELFSAARLGSSPVLNKTVSTESTDPSPRFKRKARNKSVFLRSGNDGHMSIPSGHFRSTSADRQDGPKRHNRSVSLMNGGRVVLKNEFGKDKETQKFFMKMLTSKAIIELKNVDTWDHFDVWSFSDYTGGKPLTALFLHLLQRYDLFNRCRIDREKCTNFILSIEAGYLDVPYHNKVHATDVLHAMHFFCQSSTIRPACDKFPIIRFSAYLAAAIHDFRHPGTNNAYQKHSASPEALTYNDISILESMHVSASFKLMRQSRYNMMLNLSREEKAQVRKLVIHLVLHTDMSKHNDTLRRLKNQSQYRSEKNMKWFTSEDLNDIEKDAEFILGVAIKAADLSNPCKPKKLSVEWANRITKEFWRQGDLEKVLGLPVGPGNDKKTANVPLSQQFFIKVLVSPFYLAWQKVIPEAKICLEHLQMNLRYWTKKAEKDKGNKKKSPTK